MTSAISAKGTLLKRDGTTIAEVKDISGPSLSAEVADVTSHDSANGWREKIKTLLDAGEVTFDINFVPTGASHKDSDGGLLYDLKTLTSAGTQTWSVVFPDGLSTTWSFSAFVSGFDPSMPVDGPAEASITLTVTGEPTLA